MGSGLAARGARRGAGSGSPRCAPGDANCQRPLWITLSKVLGKWATPRTPGRLPSDEALAGHPSGGPGAQLGRSEPLDLFRKLPTCGRIHSQLGQSARDDPQAVAPHGSRRASGARTDGRVVVAGALVRAEPGRPATSSGGVALTACECETMGSPLSRRTPLADLRRAKEPRETAGVAATGGGRVGGRSTSALSVCEMLCCARRVGSADIDSSSSSSSFTLGGPVAVGERAKVRRARARCTSVRERR